MRVFDYNNYRDFLQNWVKSQPNNGRGMQLKLARAAQVQATFISQVLSGKSNPSVEQAFAMAEFMKLSDLDLEYFQLLVQIERAGNTKYLNHLKQKQKNLLVQAKKISNYLQPQNAPSQLDQQKYFSSWVYPAIHLMLLIPEYSNVKAVAQRLALSEKSVEATVQFLIQSGVLEFSNGIYTSTSLRMHAEKGTAKLSGYQMTARARAQQRAAEGSEQNMHYTSIHSASREDFEKLKNQLLATIRSSDKRIESSDAEDVFGFTIDLFKI